MTLEKVAVYRPPFYTVKIQGGEGKTMSKTTKTTPTTKATTDEKTLFTTDLLTAYEKAGHSLCMGVWIEIFIFPGKNKKSFSFLSLISPVYVIVPYLTGSDIGFYQATIIKNLLLWQEKTNLNH